MPAGKLPRPYLPLLGIILAMGMPASAAGMRIEEFGLGSIWEVWALALALVAAAIACLRQASSRGNRVLALPVLLLLPAAGILLFGSMFFLDEAFPKRHRDPGIIRVKRVVGGWSAWTDTANAGGEKRVLVSYLGRDSGSLFMVENHEDEVREYPRTFLCFNLYDAPEPQRYSDTAAKAIALEIHRFDGWSGQGLPETALRYDFTVRRRGETYILQGRLGGIDIGGTYPRAWDQTWIPFAPPGWVRPAAYR